MGARARNRAHAVLEWVDYDNEHEHGHELKKAEFAYLELHRRSLFAAYLG